MRAKSGKVNERRPTNSLPKSPGAGPTQSSPEWLRDLQKCLSRWYRRNARDLPWRRTHDPYAIWISETMLQQTQVATVIPYYERFLNSFPTIADLAKAPEASVLRHWEGLGYYRRARQLHKAAQVLVSEHGGRFPRELEQIRALPGIGRYTAGAIVSFAFDEPAPIVEANTLRVYCRLLAFAGDPRGTAGQRLLWETAEQWLPRRHAGEFNQALMELGSTVCKPREPACDACPVWHLCPTRAQGRQNEIPAAAQPKNFEAVREAALVVRRKHSVLLVRRGEGERWAGLWDFPRFAVTATANAKLRGELQDKLRDSIGVNVAVGEKLVTYKHGVTRFRITLDCFSAEQTDDSSRGRRSKLDRSAAEIRWVDLAELDDYALPVTGRKLAKFISK